LLDFSAQPATVAPLLGGLDAYFWSGDVAQTNPVSGRASFSMAFVRLFPRKPGGRARNPEG
jgi:hypothetical protein